MTALVSSIPQRLCLSCYLTALILALISASSLAASHATNQHYGLRYDLTLKPNAKTAEASITVDGRIKDNIRSWRFHIDPKRHTNFRGDGQIQADGEYVAWTPPTSGGKISFELPINTERPNGRYDALMTDDWAIFRGDDIFPPARTDQHDEAEADATLHVHLPKSWSFVSAYPEQDGEDGVYEVEHAHRSFDRPTGWMAAGRLGTRRERIAGTQVVVVGPMNQGVRRMDTLAMLQWNLPRVRKLVPTMSKRLVIVSAGDPMWRGGLSGPSSVFLHADRPLISENGSSTLVHELIHVATGIQGELGADWIVEGMAEYYSLKLMWRSGTISDSRYKKAFEKLAEWGKEAERLDVEMSRGPITARAVGIMRELDHEIYRRTDKKKSLDDVVRDLTAARKKVSLASFRESAEKLIGAPSTTLSDKNLGLKTTKPAEPTNKP